MNDVYVRIAKKGVEKFHRCGEKFTSAWRKLEGVDDATRQRLREEQMLEVSDTKPEGFEPTAEDGAALQLFSSDGLSILERKIIAIAPQLDTGSLEAIFDAISEDNAATHRADGDLIVTLTKQRDDADAECARLAGLLDQSLLEAGKLAEENTRLQAQLAALDTPATAAAPVGASASTGDDAAAEGAKGTAEDLIAAGDAALAKLAEGVPADTETNTKKARK